MDVPCPKRNSTRPNIAGLMSPVQQAEMRVLLAGKWPPLKPLPVFKYETDEYRASIDFDKTRGEWVCHKTFLPSNKVQELRGGLTEVTVTLPHGQAEVFAECAAAKQQEQELEKDTRRRLQAMLEWRENYENGALYSELGDYLSESQQNEIEESIRLTLTARQLQFSPKNVEYVFDALSKAGGKLATLIGIARQNKNEKEAGVPAKAEAAAPDAERHVPVEVTHPTRDRRLQMRTTPASRAYAELGGSNGPAAEFEGLTTAPVERVIPATLESLPEEPIESVLPEQDQPCSPELIAHTASQEFKVVTPEIQDANPPSFVDGLQEVVHEHAPVAGFGRYVQTSKVESSADRIENSPSRLYALEISGFQVAAIMFLFAVISLAIGLTVGRGPLGGGLWDTQKSIPAVDATSSALLDGPGETTSQTSADTFLTPEVNPPAPTTSESRSESLSAQSLNARREDSATNVGPIGPSSPMTARSLTDSENPEARPEHKGSTGLIARNAPPLANSQPADSAWPVGPISGAPRNPAPRRAKPAPRAAPYWSSPSTVLVTGPGDGSKPFRLVLPQKTIAASSSFAMASQLSVLVAPEPGPAVTHEPARLQAGELVSFVWPRYPRPGDRHGPSETVKVRTTIGELGQVLDVKHVSGSISLLPAAMSAIRLWRYKPTLLNSRPVQTQQDVTIEFRPPQHLPRVSTRHPSRN